MKSVYVLLVLILAASVLGCVGKKAPESRTPVTPTETTISPAGTVSPAETPASAEDLFGTEDDITALDSLVNDSDMDISLSDATI